MFTAVPRTVAEIVLASSALIIRHRATFLAVTANVRRTWAHAQKPSETGGEEASKSHEIGVSVRCPFLPDLLG